MADKMSKKELKAPDTFQKVGGEARDWMAERQKLVTTVVALVLGVGLLVALVSYFSKRSDEQTSVRSALNCEVIAVGVLLRDQIFSGRSKVVEHILFFVEHAGAVPVFAEFCSASQVGDGIYAATF